MGSAGSVQFDSSAEALARAAESASKPAIVVQLIRKEEIDVATALSLDEPTVDSLVQRRIDGKKIMGALRQMRSALHSSVRDGFCEDPGNVFLSEPFPSPSRMGGSVGGTTLPFGQQSGSGGQLALSSPQRTLSSSARSPLPQSPSAQRKQRLRDVKAAVSDAERKCNFPLVIDIMRANPEDMKIQRMGCGAIGGIAREMPDKLPLIRAGGLECVTMALRRHSQPADRIARSRRYC